MVVTDHEDPTVSEIDATAWYWCQVHERPEPEGEACRAQDRLGPYATREAAINWKDRVDARNDRWDEQDDAWEGED